MKSSTRKKKRATKTTKRRKPARKPRRYIKCETCLGYVNQAEVDLHVCAPLKDELIEEICEPEIFDAFVKLRAFAMGLGEQRNYASSKAVMFAKETCYMFVRPKRKRLEISILMAREIESELVKKVVQASKKRYCHVIDVTHEDAIEEPLTDLIVEAFESV